MKTRISPRSTVSGFAFGEHVGTEKTSRRRNYDGFELSGNSLRVFLLPLFLVIFLFVLTLRLISLQLFQGSYYRGLSNSNRIKTTVIHAPRGIIFDRNGIPLVFNIPGFREKIGDATKLLSRDEAISLIAKGDTSLEVDNLREYPYKDAFSHVLGYTGQISKDELKESQFSSYLGNDVVGKMGIEKEYEKLLRGVDGKQLGEVDATGKVVRTLGQTDPIAGGDITITLDAKLQQSAFSAMSDVKKGAIIVTTPKGEVLTMISKPSFDPNLFTQGEQYKTATESSYQTVSSLLLDLGNQPLLNRAISGTYPPGSTFKLIVASAGLTSNSIDDSWQIEDTGILRVGVFSFANWYFTGYGKTEGSVNIVKGIKRSNDIFFYKLAEKVGIEKIAQTARNFFLGKKLGIDLEGEAKGVVPDEEWKEKVIGEPWYLGDTYHLGIGQGFLLTTPLQVNSWTQAIANGGVLYQPHLLKSSETKIENSKLLDEHSFNLIREGMVEACSTGGVAWPLFDFRIKNSKLPIDGKNFTEVPEATTSAQFGDFRRVAVACKTGTAEHGSDQTLPHAWITLFVPAYNPQIVVTVLAESSGEGSNVAAPIAKKILEDWFSR